MTRKPVYIMLRWETSWKILAGVRIPALLRILRSFQAAAVQLLCWVSLDYRLTQHRAFTCIAWVHFAPLMLFSGSTWSYWKDFLSCSKNLSPIRLFSLEFLKLMSSFELIASIITNKLFELDQPFLAIAKSNIKPEQIVYIGPREKQKWTQVPSVALGCLGSCCTSTHLNVRTPGKVWS